MHVQEMCKGKWIFFTYTLIKVFFISFLYRLDYSYN